MQTNDAKSIKECLQSNALKLLVQKAQKILALETFLNQILPPEIVPYCRIMNLSQGTLTLHLKSPVWATRVHYLGPYLLKQLSQQDLMIRKIQCRVQPDL
ncbi:DciA family protein [Coxiella-like endosymbiont]|uniref:DciA family protein n=1 Tax=Coxiella-like endosymbiont TaxID=1592897 RepID=UPI000C80029D|nr:DciA family protein [Coxiella-like endosymbiont]PMB54352.1 Zn-ribbon-containing [Coxiella-like endosymbiont]